MDVLSASPRRNSLIATSIARLPDGFCRSVARLYHLTTPLLFLRGGKAILAVNARPRGVP